MGSAGVDICGVALTVLILILIVSGLALWLLESEAGPVQRWITRSPAASRLRRRLEIWRDRRAEPRRPAALDR